jgi:CelD/BcsL family acetyltransferase involved in cellulose biosynthesis
MSHSNVMRRPSESHVSAELATARTGTHGTTSTDDAPQLPFSVSPPLGVITSRQVEPASGAGIVVRIASDLDEVKQHWTVFERHADRTVFQSFDWLAAWQRTIGAPQGTIPAIVLGRDGDGTLLFILPLAVETHGALRRLTWLASRLCDYNAPLLAGEFSARVSAERFLAAWRDALARMRVDPRLRFDLVDLQKMPETVGEQRNPFLDLAVLPHPSGAYVATLGRDWETFYAGKRSSATRKKERRQLKHLAEHGEIRFVTARDRTDVERTIATLIDQKSRAFARMGVENLFARPGRRDFFLAIATDPALREVVHVSRLDLGGAMIATGVGLKFRDCYYLILSSYDGGELARLGPGRAHLHELLRYAIDCGLARFDFTVGDEPYKHDWADTELQLHDHLAAVSLRGWPLTAGTTAFRRAKRMIKQSPALWRAFSKARAFAGVLGRYGRGRRRSS